MEAGGCSVARLLWLGWSGRRDVGDGVVGSAGGRGRRGGLCSNRADDSLIANQNPGSGNSDQVCLFSTAGGNVCDGNSVGNSANAVCGNSGVWGSGVTCGGTPWAGASGTSCDYTLTTRPSPCADYISP